MAGAPRLLNRLCRGWGKVEDLGMHDMVLQTFGFDRCERAKADVQCDMADAYAASAQCIEHPSGEVKSGRRGGGRAGGVREDRLVAFAVLEGRGACACDVGRERDLSKGLEHVLDVRGPLEPQPIMAFGILGLDDRSNDTRGGERR